MIFINLIIINFFTDFTIYYNTGIQNNFGLQLYL